jgi:hypothetical protein
MTTTRPGEYLVPTSARPAVCRSCGASIAWTKTATGRAVPLDLATVEHRDGARWALTHFATCEHARDWRGNGAVTPPAVGTPPWEDPRWAAWRERSQLADDTLPLAWWSAFRRDLRSAPAVSRSDIDREAALAAGEDAPS